MPTNPNPDGSARGAPDAVGRELKRSDAKTGPEQDAKGQSEKDHKGGANNGVSSADPRVISGKENGDATWPLRQDRPKGK